MKDELLLTGFKMAIEEHTKEMRAFRYTLLVLVITGIVIVLLIWVVKRYEIALFFKGVSHIR